MIQNLVYTNLGAAIEAKEDDDVEPIEKKKGGKKFKDEGNSCIF